mmetsp:Transcript_20620/g.70797  ORF Transcript_20620/g.70797 Transcript_20620/m.70797 type:complete len:497 (+) Transcript_20620:92-1582(+)
MWSEASRNAATKLCHGPSAALVTSIKATRPRSAAAAASRSAREAASTTRPCKASCSGSASAPAGHVGMARSTAATSQHAATRTSARSVSASMVAAEPRICAHGHGAAADAEASSFVATTKAKKSAASCTLWQGIDTVAATTAATAARSVVWCNVSSFAATRLAALTHQSSAALSSPASAISKSMDTYGAAAAASARCARLANARSNSTASRSRRCAGGRRSAGMAWRATQASAFVAAARCCSSCDSANVLWRSAYLIDFQADLSASDRGRNCVSSRCLPGRTSAVQTLTKASASGSAPSGATCSTSSGKDKTALLRSAGATAATLCRSACAATSVRFASLATNANEAASTFARPSRSMRSTSRSSTPWAGAWPRSSAPAARSTSMWTSSFKAPSFASAAMAVGSRSAANADAPAGASMVLRQPPASRCASREHASKSSTAAQRRLAWAHWSGTFDAGPQSTAAACVAGAASASRVTCLANHSKAPSSSTARPTASA